MSRGHKAVAEGRPGLYQETFCAKDKFRAVSSDPGFSIHSDASSGEYLLDAYPSPPLPNSP
jgi:hypothetical protein